jgi:hypothetical protein
MCTLRIFGILLTDEREVTEANPVPIPLCPPHIPNGMSPALRGRGVNIFYERANIFRV